MLKIFLSSVSRGLETIRTQIADDLRTSQYSVLNMELFGARPELPIEACLEEVRQADALVLIIGPRYGSLTPANDVSYTHEEFREARRRGIPVLAFVLDPAPDADAEERRGLESLKAEAGASLLYEKTTPEDLRARILASLSREKNKGTLGPSFSFFQQWGRFFGRQITENADRKPLFNHLSPFTGRDTEVGRLVEFIHSDGPIMILAAPGGCGKSRLLLEMAQRIDPAKSGCGVLFVTTDGEWTAEDIKVLPGAPTVVVIDDAHRRPDLDRLISACLSQNPLTRFLIACRPGALDFIQYQTRELMPDDAGNTILPLPPLEPDVCVELAVKLLGTKYEHLADRLVKLADSNPLVICIGARCIASNQVAPEILSQTPEVFRHTVLDRLLDDPSLAGDPTGFPRKVLDTLAAIGPVPAEGEDTQATVAACLSVQKHDIASIMAKLERSEFIQRRGRFLRITPDVLADHLLYRAAVGATGQSTGFVDHILATCGQAYTANILANAAELDWRTTAIGAPNQVLTGIWRSLKTQLPELSHPQRADLLNNLRRAAVYAPEPVLEIVEWMCEHPEAPQDATLSPLGLDRHDRLCETICDLLSLIGTHPGYTKRCMRRLGDFAETDERSTNPLPLHPRRRIQDLLKYNRNHLKGVQANALDFAVERLTAPLPSTSLTWAVDAIGEVLNRCGESVRGNRRGVTIGSFPLAPDLARIQPLRNQAIDCLFRLAIESRAEEAAAATRTIATLFCKPPGLFGREVREEEVETWLPEAKRATDLLQRIAREAKEPVVRYLARRSLREFSHVHWPELGKHVDSALGNAPAVPDEGLYDILAGIPREQMAEDWRHQEKLVPGLCAKIAKGLWDAERTPEGVANRILTAATIVRAAFGELSWYARQLAEALVEAQPSSAVDLLHVVSTWPNDGELWMIPSLLDALQSMGERSPALEFIRETVGAPRETLRRHAAESLRYLMRPEHTVASDLELLKPYLGDPSSVVRRIAVGALVIFAKAHPQDALATLVSIDFSSDVSLADAVFEALHPDFGLNPTLLTDEQIDALLERLTDFPSLGGHTHGILAFIAFASIRRPWRTVNLLLSRIQASDAHAPSRGYENWTPIPYNGHGLSLPGLMQSPDYPGLLRQIRDAALDAPLLASIWLPHLFRVAATDTEVGLTVLREWAVSDKPELVIGAARLLREFDHSLVFSIHEFIATLLENAANLNRECYDRVSGELLALAIGGVSCGAVGEPSPRHVHDKEQARALSERYRNRKPVKHFYEVLVKHAEDRIRFDIAEFEEDLE